MRLASLICVALAFVACAGDDGRAPAPDVNPHGSHDAAVSSDLSVPGDTYVAGLTKEGKNLKISLVESDPAPPRRGNNEWTLRIIDMADAPKTGCTIGIKPLMPAHGHGTTPLPTITEKGGGEYSADPLNLFMPGLWSVPIEIDCGGTKDTVIFEFWIEG